MAWPTTSRHQRGYGSSWDKLRLVILKRDKYLCQCDQCKGGRPGGRLTVASDVNHIIPKAKAKAMGWTDEQIDDPTNLQSVAGDCHERITAEQFGGTYRPKVKIGLDGFPIGS